MFFLNSCLQCVLGQSLTGALGCMAPHPGCPVDLGDQTYVLMLL